MPSLAPQSTVPDTEELADFRDRWLDEIRERGQQTQHLPTSHAGPSDQQARLSPALEAYTLAVSKEQSGDHPEATRLYRKAFRLDPNVDKAYHPEEQARQSRHELATASMLPMGMKNLSLAGANRSAATQAVPAFNTLAVLLKSWPHPLLFAPDNETMAVPMNKLPDELLISVLYSFALTADARSIERFAVVSRRARILSLDTSLWRQMVQLTMVPPQLSDPATTLAKLIERYRFDYRRLFIEHPRLRFDGVYISKCYYVRNGHGENPWVTISHLITYHRFLRFLPNGQVLSYRANEDQEAGEVVRVLQPGLHRKGLCLGNWRLNGTRVLVTDLAEKAAIEPMSSDKYSFRMSLTLKSRPSLGRWNKLDFLTYESVNVETGEIDTFSLRHERPYWFSKVNSYQWAAPHMY